MSLVVVLLLFQEYLGCRFVSLLGGVLVNLHSNQNLSQFSFFLYKKFEKVKAIYKFRGAVSLLKAHFSHLYNGDNNKPMSQKYY